MMHPMPIRIVCTGSASFPHRKVTVMQTEDLNWNLADASLELHCTRCGQAPRPGHLTVRALIQLARDAGGELDIRRA